MAATMQRPLTANEIFRVFEYLAEGTDLNAENWRQLVQVRFFKTLFFNGTFMTVCFFQMLIEAVRLMKLETADWKGATALELANLVAASTNVAPDGTLTPRTGPPPVRVSLNFLIFEKDERRRNFLLVFLETRRNRWFARDVQRLLVGVVQSGTRTSHARRFATANG